MKAMSTGHLFQRLSLPPLVIAATPTVSRDVGPTRRKTGEFLGGYAKAELDLIRCP